MIDIGFYDLSFNPFEKNSLLGHQKFISRDHRKAVQAMKGAFEEEGFAVIVAPPGIGKSVAIDDFISYVDTSKHAISYVAAGNSKLQELYKLIAIEFKLESEGGSNKLRTIIKRFLLNNHMRNQSSVVIIDEAQDLKPKVLTDLRILRNFEHDTLDAFTLILTGEPKLANIIEHNEDLDALKQRVTHHYYFLGLSDMEISDYINHRLQFAGGSNILVDDEAMAVLCESSRGITRIVDRIMSNAIAWGVQMQRRTIDKEVMERAIGSLALTPPNFSSKSKSKGKKASSSSDTIIMGDTGNDIF